MTVIKKILSIGCLSLPCLGLAVYDDKVEQTGIDFVHFNGMSGHVYFHEMMGAGVALFDYDNDGDLDVYFSQGKMIGDELIEKATISSKYESPMSDRLFRNDSTNERLKFVDVTNESKIKAYGYGMGVSVADIDNDGDVDIYLSNYGSNEMWQNNGDGTFSNISKKSNTSNENWSVGATFFDFDKDGYLDLYVVNYVEYSIDMPVECKSYGGALDYCSPQGFKYQYDSLYHNNQDATFTNVSARSGIHKSRLPGLGVVSADFNKDGWLDLYVANDGMPNSLWINNQKGGFDDKAMESGVAVNMTGVPEASMGVDAADFDNDGDVDLFMTHLKRQTNTLYKNNGKGWFFDAGVSMGVASSSFKFTGFGTIWFDYDNDGFLDLFSANGAVIMEPEQVANKIIHPLKQQNQLWHNLGNGKYKEVSLEQSLSFLRPDVSRGAALGDLNNDGKIDLVVSNNAGRPHVLINQSKNENWVGLKLFRKDLNRVDTGAQVELKIGEKKIYRRVKTDGSYASAHDSRIILGMGEIKSPIKLKIIWSDGKVQEVNTVEINKYTKIVRDK